MHACFCLCAFVRRQAWVLNATFADNVTLGEPLDEGRWAEVVEVRCAGGYKGTAASLMYNGCQERQLV
jgi:hypothetical protein